MKSQENRTIQIIPRFYAVAVSVDPKDKPFVNTENVTSSLKDCEHYYETVLFVL